MASRRGIVGGGGGGVSFSSGGTTVNVIPKEDGSGGLKDSALTDNGTNVISTGAILAPAGTTALPGYAFSGQAADGLTVNGSNQVGLIASNGVLGWWQVNPNVSGVSTGSTTTIGWNSGTTIFGGGIDAGFRRRTTANIQLGIAADVNGSPVAQTISVQNAITGSDLPGSTFTIDAPLGTGLGAGAKIALNRGLMKATGATAQTSVNAFAVGQSKTLSSTSATAQVIANITLGSNAGGGAAGTFTIVATDGTNFDSETQSFNVSFVNKAGAVTVGSVVVTSSTAASNSGSCTLGITAVANSNNIDIKVTPVFTTIVPTTVTLYPVISHSTGTITFS